MSQVTEKSVHYQKEFSYIKIIKTSTFFFSSRRRHRRSKRDWSSDVCSSDLPIGDQQTLADYYKAAVPQTLNTQPWATMNYWINYPKFMVSLLKALYGNASTKDNDWGYGRSEEHTSELQSRFDLVCRLLLEKK